MSQAGGETHEDSQATHSQNRDHAESDAEESLPLAVRPSAKLLNAAEAFTALVSAPKGEQCGAAVSILISAFSQDVSHFTRMNEEELLCAGEVIDKLNCSMDKHDLVLNLIRFKATFCITSAFYGSSPARLAMPSNCTVFQFYHRFAVKDARVHLCDNALNTVHFTEPLWSAIAARFIRDPVAVHLTVQKLKKAQAVIFKKNSLNYFVYEEPVRLRMVEVFVDQLFQLGKRVRCNKTFVELLNSAKDQVLEEMGRAIEEVQEHGADVLDTAAHGVVEADQAREGGAAGEQQLADVHSNAQQGQEREQGVAVEVGANGANNNCAQSGVSVDQQGDSAVATAANERQPTADQMNAPAREEGEQNVAAHNDADGPRRSMRPRTIPAKFDPAPIPTRTCTAARRSKKRPFPDKKSEEEWSDTDSDSERENGHACGVTDAMNIKSLVVKYTETEAILDRQVFISYDKRMRELRRKLSEVEEIKIKWKEAERRAKDYKEVLREVKAGNVKAVETVTLDDSEDEDD